MISFRLQVSRIPYNHDLPRSLSVAFAVDITSHRKLNDTDRYVRDIISLLPFQLAIGEPYFAALIKTSDQMIDKAGMRHH